VGQVAPAPEHGARGFQADVVVILHDPQTAGMLPAIRAAADVPVIWRAHIGLDLPNDVAREAWSFLTPYLE
jgi:trehalose synthase